MSGLKNLPIKRVSGVVEVDFLHGKNPALLTSAFNLRKPVLRHVIDNTWADNTFVTTDRRVHTIIEEEEHSVEPQLRQNILFLEGRETPDIPGLRYQRAPLEPRSFYLNEKQISGNLHHVQLNMNRPTIPSLTHSSNTNAINMTTVISAPGSPPELTESQSSKSSASSYALDLSTSEEFLSGNMHFEEINLEDEKHDARAEERLKRYDNKENTTSYEHNAKRPPLATIQTQPNRYLRSVENGAKSASATSSKRGFTTPVATAIASQQTSRTRSESPALHKNKSASRLGQFAQTPATSLTVDRRRGSWQPTRKTIYEIEAEYHESDDELPDDASLFNVPVSPYTSWPRSARSSARGSPERDSPAHSPSPIPLGHARTAPDAPPKRQHSSKVLPRQRLTPRSSSGSLTASKSAPSRNSLRDGRTKSWNLVMADLDHESRIIAEKLDYHAEANVRLGSSPSLNRASAPGAIPLPPIQRGTLDFMPISKEKEAVLSRTRPSWLPPKDPKEEKRHLMEYQRMMKASIEADKKKEEQTKRHPCTDDTTRDSLHRIWAYYIEPTTDLATIDRRVNDLCWRGIPSKLRGPVWKRTVGNPLGLTEKSYTLALQRVAEIKSKTPANLTELEKKMKGWFTDIERDAETAFPELSMFRREGPQWRDLIKLCEAYASYRGDVGYLYGMQLVAALVLLQLPKPAEAFILLANCLNKTLPLAFQTGDIVATGRAYAKVKSTLDIKFPRLHSYLFSDQDQGGLGFSGEELLEPMFRTLFANGLDLDRLCRVWDIWIFESDRYLVRTAVALLGALQNQIFDIQGDIDLRRRNIQESLGWGPFNRTNSGYWDLSALGDEELFVEEIRAAGKLDCAGR